MDRFHRWLKKPWIIHLVSLFCIVKSRSNVGEHFMKSFHFSLSLSPCVYVARAIVAGEGGSDCAESERSVSCASTVCTLDDKEIKYVGGVVGLSIQCMTESILIPIYFWVVACQNRFPIPRSSCWFGFYFLVSFFIRSDPKWNACRSFDEPCVRHEMPMSHKENESFSSRKMCQTCCDTLRWHLSNRFEMNTIIFICLLLPY